MSVEWIARAMLAGVTAAGMLLVAGNSYGAEKRKPKGSKGLYGVSGLAQRSYEQDGAKKGAKKGVQSRGKSQSGVPTGKNKYIEYRKAY